MSSNNPIDNRVALPATSQDNGPQASSQSLSGALTFPAVSGRQNIQNGQSQSNALSLSASNTGSLSNAQQRPVRNLQGLLKFAMDATQAEDAPGNTELAPMDEERRVFLEEALKSLTVNVAEALDNAIKVLTNLEKLNNIQEGDPLPEDVKNSFTILLDFIDDIDVANDFYKMGGFAMFPMCYSSKNADLRARASSVLGTLCQNNPFCQKKALDCGLLDVLINLVHHEQGITLAKCLYAISCMCRGYEPACQELIAQGGCPILVELLNAPDSAAKTKAAFLIRYFSQHYCDAMKQFVRNNIIKNIIGQIQAGRDESTEHMLSILQVLVSTNDANVLRLCRDHRYNLKKVLEEYQKLPELRDERYAEEKHYCQYLLNIVFGNQSFLQLNADEELADR